MHQKTIASGEKYFTGYYQIPAPYGSQIIDWQIDNFHMYASLLNQQEVIVYGSFSLILCYSRSAVDLTEKIYEVSTTSHSIVETIRFNWQLQKSISAFDYKIKTDPHSFTLWRCDIEPIPGKNYNPYSIQGLANLINPQPSTFNVTVKGPLKIVLYIEDTLPIAESKQPSSEAETFNSHKLKQLFQEAWAAQEDNLIERLKAYWEEVLNMQEEKLTQKFSPLISENTTAHTATNKKQAKEKPKQQSATSTQPKNKPPAQHYSFLPKHSSHASHDLPGKQHPIASEQRAINSKQDQSAKIKPKNQSAATIPKEQPIKSIGLTGKKWPDLSRLQPPPKPSGSG
jgi:hypothetical protein